MSSLIQNSDSSLGIAKPTDGGPNEFTFTDMRWTAASTSGPSFVASRPYQLKSLTAAVEVAGTDAGAVTATVYVAPSGTALASGTALHTGTINLKGTAATNQVLTLGTTTLIPAGSRVGIVFTGVLTAAVGCCTAGFCPI